MTLPLLLPDWPAPGRVRAAQTTREGGVSQGVYRALNLGTRCGDAPAAVEENRRRLCAAARLPAEPRWLRQVHGVAVVDAADAKADVGAEPEADAAVTRTPGVVCAVQTADCLPVLICDRAGTVVGAAHAGWRGLCAGVIEVTLRAMQADPRELLAWLGPAIGPQSFEVGPEVRAAFVGLDARAAQAFTPRAGDRWNADLYTLARQRLQAAGVAGIFGGGLDSFGEPSRFYSFRRDGACGRMATLIWIEPD